MRLIITGVAKTAIRPEPTKGAVCSGPTTISAVPVRPGTIRSRSAGPLRGEDIWLYSVNSADRAKRLVWYHGDATARGFEHVSLRASGSRPDRVRAGGA